IRVGIRRRGDVKRQLARDAFETEQIVERARKIVGQKDRVVADVRRPAANSPVKGHYAGRHLHAAGGCPSWRLIAEPLGVRLGQTNIRDDRRALMKSPVSQFDAGDAAIFDDYSPDTLTGLNLNAELTRQTLDPLDQRINAPLRQPQAISQLAVGQN